MPGVVTIQSTLIQSASGQKTIGPLLVSAVNNVGQTLDIAFASATAVSITPPGFATGVVITPPTGNLVGLTLKGVSGDTGIGISPNLPILIAFANTTTPAGFVLTSAGAIVGNVELSYF